MRDFNEGDAVSAMTLEHYPEMTEKQLQQIIDEAQRRWDIIDALIVHRVGLILPGQPIVLTAVWSAHRAAAFDACRFLMEALKTRATFWKKETLADGDQRWVEKNTPG
jgi:molybdopterin synthase catalytic subunit